MRTDINELNNSEIVDLLWKLNSMNMLDGIVPGGVVIDILSHDTATHCHIYLRSEGLDDLLIWYKTDWCSPTYEFNERNKVEGFQPGCDFIKPLLNGFFMTAKSLLDQKIKEREDKKKDKVMLAEIEHENLLNSYKSKYG